MHRKIICLPSEVFEKTDIYRKKWRQVQFNKVNGEECCLSPNSTPWFCLLKRTPLEGIGISAVLKMYPGPDGLVRTVKVKTNDAVYVHPIQKLCLLETDVEDADKM